MVVFKTLIVLNYRIYILLPKVDKKVFYYYWENFSCQLWRWNCIGHHRQNLNFVKRRGFSYHIYNFSKNLVFSEIVIDATDNTAYKGIKAIKLSLFKHSIKINKLEALWDLKMRVRRFRRVSIYFILTPSLANILPSSTIPWGLQKVFCRMCSIYEQS